jgi:hypothetical protein
LDPRGEEQQSLAVEGVRGLDPDDCKESLCPLFGMINVYGAYRRGRVVGCINTGGTH